MPSAVPSAPVRRGKRAAVAVVVAVFLASFLGSAYAASASSARLKFFGPTLIAGVYQCAKQYALVNNTSKTAYGFIEAYRTTSCDTYNNRPPGHLGTSEFLLKGTSGSGGIVCGFRDWTYNSGTAAALGVPAFWSGPNGPCPAGAAYYSWSQGRYWRTDQSVYVTGPFSSSPNLNC